jgi:hypothetical protein
MSNSVTQRRPLHFEHVDAIVDEAARLHKVGYDKLGQWSLGQACAHVAILMECSLDGFSFKMPLALRMVGRLLKKRLLRNGLPTGLKFPAPAAATLTPPNVSDEVGLARLRVAVARLKDESPHAASPVLGALSPDDWRMFHCRHAELHLSFLIPAERTDALSNE